MLSCDNDAEIFYDEGDFCGRSVIIFTDNFRIGNRWIDDSEEF